MAKSPSVTLAPEKANRRVRSGVFADALKTLDLLGKGYYALPSDLIFPTVGPRQTSTKKQHGTARALLVKGGAKSGGLFLIEGGAKGERAGSASPPATGVSPLQQAFLQRSLSAIERASRHITAEAMTSALAAPTDIGALARVLADAAVADAATSDLDPFAAGLARNAQHREELVARSGGLLSAEDTGRLLGITRQAIDKRRTNKRLLAVRQAGDWRYPAFQFEHDGPPEGLKDVLEILDDPNGWWGLDFLLAPDTVLEGKSPFDALRAGPDWTARVLRVARGTRGDGFS